MFSVRRIIFGLAAGLMLPLTTGVLSPEAMPAPAVQVLPTVSGDIDAAIHGDAARFGPERLWCSPHAQFCAHLGIYRAQAQINTSMSFKD